MDLAFVVVLFLIGFIGSFLSGMVGIGGSIIKYPMLLYIPPLMGFTAFTAHEVSGISAIQVFFATLSGVFAFRKSGFINKELIIIMGINSLFGSLIGSYGSKFLVGDAVNTVYAILAAIAAIMMLIPKKIEEEMPTDGKLRYNKTLAGICAFIIGVAAGVVGAGGGFILVPVMLVILRIPTRVTIATSLAVIFISSIGSTVGKVATGQIVYLPAIIMILASVIAAPLGANLSKRVSNKLLQGILAILILSTAIKIWSDLVF